MIVATPLDIPPIIPDDWNVFWNVWNQNSKPLIKVKQNLLQSDALLGQDDLWQGLDIYRKYNVTTAWSAPYYDISTELPKLYQSIVELPLNFIHRVRILSSKVDIAAHSDDNLDKWSVRAFLKNDDPESQWYFTEPRKDTVNRQFLKMPTDTNWFAYNDKHSWHGSIFKEQYPKLLLQVFVAGDIMPLINRSISKYKNYIIEI